MFKRFICSLATLMLGCFVAHSQDKSLPKDLYIASTIPDSLKQDANSVIRYSADEMTVSAPGRAVTRHHGIVSLLNEKADDEARLVLFYDKKFISVNSMQMLVYNAEGKLIKKYSKSDAYERSATDGFSIITDDRLLALRHDVGTYPVTVETIYEINQNSYLDLNAWHIQPAETAVQSSSYKIVVNPGIGFRYKNKNTTIAPIKANNGKYDIYTWQVNNLKAFKPEEEVPDWRLEAKVEFASNNFEYNGLPGNFSSWQSFGAWYSALSADVSTLSPLRTAEIKAMVAGYRTDKEKARFLYNYMQQNMRYVSIQLGIGGLKPFPAMFVDQKKYGDCKALSNYMYALLKAVDIPSYCALVRAGKNAEAADVDFPSSSFNHMILCVPFKGDTTWLECTSNTHPFGKLGTFTENRNALLITENGGKLVNTPKSTGADNQFNSRVHIELDADGGAKAKVKILSTGGYRDLFVNRFSTISQDKQKEYLLMAYNIKQPIAFEFKEAPDSAGIKEVNLDLEYDNFCDIAAGSKRFYRPRVFDLWVATMPAEQHRKNDYYFEHPMQKSCVTTIALPPGFEAESLPADVSLKFSYGTYQASYKYDAAKNEVISTVKFDLNNQVIPAARYTEMQQYMDNIAKAQNKKLVIKRKA
ncbi:DUF3857 and transglutaminase domain-containing protein [Mucilaginibacter sp. Bleaf8]|uniref:DUF3857 domain-containing protein n=1 Tax=Mucilaginibacter sp. Bleaf8 TaxID=2834430 RepID=UPI001BD072AE|nr:DUF3857 and transglutaminase domain-containing protein [Mucilaginibacter sp. Bleaf8]MBS7565863.1 DUF3857 and transglutaminase domain-containing protein [Mucilaginibacter sp. Bleaf8]